MPIDTETRKDSFSANTGGHSRPVESIWEYIPPDLMRKKIHLRDRQQFLLMVHILDTKFDWALPSSTQTSMRIYPQTSMSCGPISGSKPKHQALRRCRRWQRRSASRRRRFRALDLRGDDTSHLRGMASNLPAKASNLRAMASSLIAMASTLLAMASSLIAMASTHEK